jgi:CheY-like chemotaxis protein
MQAIDLAYVIDDDEILVMIVKILIKRNEHFNASESFCNGQEAIDHLKEVLRSGGQLPEVIFLDLNMPRMDGWQFLEEFVQLKIEKEIPVFIVTSSIDPADIDNAKKFPAVKDYIMKPVSDERLNKVFEMIRK